MVRHLTTLILGGILGSMVLVGNAEACYKKNCGHEAPVACAAPVVCVTPRLPAPPAPCVQSGVLQRRVPQGEVLQDHLAQALPARNSARRRRAPAPVVVACATPVSRLPRSAIRRLRHRPRLSTDRPPTIFPPISHDSLHHAVEIVTFFSMTEQPLRAPANCCRARLGYFPPRFARGPAQPFQIAVGKDPDQRDAELRDGVRGVTVRDKRTVDIRKRPGRF